MKMGRERMVLGWDIHCSLLNLQIERMQAELTDCAKRGLRLMAPATRRTGRPAHGQTYRTAAPVTGSWPFSARQNGLE